MLEIANLHAHYFGVRALEDVSLQIQDGEILSLVGSNGAGKSTTLRSISGFIPITEGTIRFMGQNIESLPSNERVDLGIIQVMEGRRLFPFLTALENLELGSYIPRAKKYRKESIERMFQMFPILKDRQQQLAGTFSGGEQQMLAIGRALMSLPKLLMLDEPSLGLAPTLVRQIFAVLKDINNQGTTIFLVEQNVNQALTLSTRGYVLENGRVVLEGKSADLLNNPFLKEAYLGL